MSFSVLLEIYEMNREKVVGQLNSIKLKRFAVLASKEAPLFTEMKMLLAGRKPNGSDF